MTLWEKRGYFCCLRWDLSAPCDGLRPESGSRIPEAATACTYLPTPHSPVAAVGGRGTAQLASECPEGSALTLFFPVFQSTPSPSADLLGLGAVPPAPAGPPSSSGGLLVDVFSDSPSAVAPLAPGSEDNFAR